MEVDGAELCFSEASVLSSMQDLSSLPRGSWRLSTPKSEHYAIYGFLFPSHKIKPNFGSIHRESRTCQQSLAKTLNFAP